MSPHDMDHVKESPPSKNSARYNLSSLKEGKTSRMDTESTHQKQKVAFACLCDMIDIPSRTAMSIEQRQDLWWSRREIREIRELEHNTKRRISRWGEDEEVENENENESCSFTSLGIHTPFQEERRERHIRKCRHAVLLEVQRQQSEHLSLPDVIRSASRRCSRPSREDAQVQGMMLAVSLGSLPQPQGDERSPKQLRSSKREEKKTRRLISHSPPRSPVRKSEITVRR